MSVERAKEIEFANLVNQVSLVVETIESLIAWQFIAIVFEEREQRDTSTDPKLGS